MWLEDYSPAEDASWPKSAEVSEKFKESAKKAAAGIKRVQKDEQKAKKFDLILVDFLVIFIRDKKYDEILESLFKVLDSGISSRFIVAILSLVYLPISDKIREITGKENLKFFYHSNENKDFDDSDIDPILRDRINHWIEDIVSIMSFDPSGIVDKRTLELIKNTDVLKFTSKVFSFFFKEINMNISPSKSNSYADFILQEVQKVLSKIEMEEV